jgi:uncharacterized protein DUF6636
MRRMLGLIAGRLMAGSLIAGAALALAPAVAAAQPPLGAQTPSHNIFCLALPAGFTPGEPASVRCDIQKAASRPPRAPKSCPLSWGDSYILYPTGAGRLLCHGDTTANPEDPVIAYGTQWRAYGFVCTSQTSGLTCVNGQRHGFSLSRAVQKAF